jgi:hypothetical protein
VQFGRGPAQRCDGGDDLIGVRHLSLSERPQAIEQPRPAVAVVRDECLGEAG